jgi:hypothetical protein
MMEKNNSAKTAARIQARPKPTAPSARPTDRVDDPDAKRRAIKLARDITKHYSMRAWAKWTHHQKHGWWTHVAAGDFDEVRFLWRDLDDLEKVLQRCLDEKRFDQELLRALDDIEAKQMALTVSIESARSLLRRKARALFVEQQSGR